MECSSVGFSIVRQTLEQLTMNRAVSVKWNVRKRIVYCICMFDIGNDMKWPERGIQMDGRVCCSRVAHRSASNLIKFKHGQTKQFTMKR